MSGAFFLHFLAFFFNLNNSLCRCVVGAFRPRFVRGAIRFSKPTASRSPIDVTSCNVRPPALIPHTRASYVRFPPFLLLLACHIVFFFANKQRVLVTRGSSASTLCVFFCGHAVHSACVDEPHGIRCFTSSFASLSESGECCVFL